MSRPASRRKSAKIERSKKRALSEDGIDDGHSDQSAAVNEDNKYPIHQSDNVNEGSIAEDDDENSPAHDNDEVSDENDEPDDKKEGLEGTDEYPRLESEKEEDAHEEQDVQLTTGMANAMARILGASLPSTKPLAAPTTVARPEAPPVTASDKPIVLSKTKTPLQVQAAKEEKERRELLETRRLHREKRQLTALHIPLSVATARIVGDNTSSSSVAVELEQERMHRRVATRGIVVLFNAIATHQANPAQTAVAAASVSATESNNKATKLTKHGFLDLIKQTAAAKVTAASAALRDSAARNVIDLPLPPTAHGKKDQRQWNALKDDYMLDSKKNWDEEEEEDEDNESLTTERPVPKKKRHKARN
jgi:Rrp15p